MSACLRVLNPGLSATIQDVGRPGFQRYGIPMSGALDEWSLRAANLLVGNEADTGALEILYYGPTFMVEADSVRLAFVGGDAQIRISSDAASPMAEIVTPLRSVRVHRGQIIQVGSVTNASTLYLAVEGGFEIPRVLGSMSTYVRGALGGFNGRALQQGDALPLVLNRASERSEQSLPHGLPPANPSVRIVPGPQLDYFASTALSQLCESRYTIEAGSDRTGLRLYGPEISHIRGHDIISDALPPGSIQIPGSKRPIVLLSDRPTTGGYPKIATVISADLATLGRAPIGSKISFSLVTAEEALEARRQMAMAMSELPNRLVRTDAGRDDLTTRLFNDNLVSGVYDACA